MITSFKKREKNLCAESENRLAWPNKYMPIKKKKSMEKKKRQASQNRVQTTTRNLHHLILGACISSAYPIAYPIKYFVYSAYYKFCFANRKKKRFTGDIGGQMLVPPDVFNLLGICRLEMCKIK